MKTGSYSIVAETDIQTSNDEKLTARDQQRFIERYPSLANIRDKAWQESVESARKIRLPEKFCVYDNCSGSQCNSFVLLLEGMVRVYYLAPDGREITLYRVTPGDLCVLSISGLFNRRRYNVIAKTDTEVTAMSISEDQFRRSLGDSEQFRNFVLSTLSERLCDLMCLVQDTAFQTIQVRLACLLVRSFAISDTDSINTTHQSLAHEIGTTREVVSRILKDFEHHDCIRLSRGAIHLTSYHGLENFARTPVM